MTTVEVMSQARPDAESDQALVARVLHGDTHAFAALYERYVDVLWRRLLRVLGRAPDVEDVLQMTFLEAYRALPRYRPELPFGPWLNGVAFRVTGQHLRSQRRRWWQRPASDADVCAGLVDPRRDRSPEVAAMSQQLTKDFYEALNRLPPKKRIAFVLHEVDGLGLTEIAEILDAQPKTVWARVESARKEVQARLASKYRHRQGGGAT